MMLLVCPHRLMSYQPYKLIFYQYHSGEIHTMNNKLINVHVNAIWDHSFDVLACVVLRASPEQPRVSFCLG